VFYYPWRHGKLPMRVLVHASADHETCNQTNQDNGDNRYGLP
jgi:hypothetical protein